MNNKITNAQEAKTLTDSSIKESKLEHNSKVLKHIDSIFMAITNAASKGAYFESYDLNKDKESLPIVIEYFKSKGFQVEHLGDKYKFYDSVIRIDWS